MFISGSQEKISSSLYKDIGNGVCMGTRHFFILGCALENVIHLVSRPFNRFIQGIKPMFVEIFIFNKGCLDLKHFGVKGEDCIANVF